MDFKTTLQKSPFIITEGGTDERIHREFNIKLNPYIHGAGLIYDSEGQAVLTKIFKQYADIGRDYNLPMFLATPTARANPERIKKSGFAAKNVNRDCFQFMDALRQTYGEYSNKVFVGGSMASKGDSYKPKEALPGDEALSFHLSQVEELTRAGVDFLIGYTLPAVSEALGMAKAMSTCDTPYILSFVVRPEGTLLDGTALKEAIALIDSEVSPNPLGYMINCVHPTIFESAITSEINSSSFVRKRVLGLQANTSSKSPEELDGSAELHTEEPSVTAQLMARLYHRFGLKILGGCCGTDNRHIRSMVDILIS
ncbi:MAG: homocysteine S-methyltransferase family protein [Firmicutes bacterium]|nr:homocysteine S-methyltransferase family protein [Bacillota bacterium]